jgi:hypothetical protein
VALGTNIASALSEVLRYRVPRGVVWKWDGTRALRGFLGFVETIASVGGAGDEVFATTHAPARVFSPSEDHFDGHYQEVHLKSNNTNCPVVAVADHIDGPTYSITASVAGNADHQVCYAPYIKGEIEILVESPRGHGELAAAVYNSDLRVLHGSNQWLSQDLRIDAPLLLPPDFSIVVRVNCAAVFRWTTLATSGATDLAWADIHIPVIEVPERIFYVRGEVSEGAELRKKADALLAAA